MSEGGAGGSSQLKNSTIFLYGSIGSPAAMFGYPIAKGMCFGDLQFLPLSMLAGVVDVDTARSRGKRAEMAVSGYI